MFRNHCDLTEAKCPIKGIIFSAFRDYEFPVRVSMIILVAFRRPTEFHMLDQLQGEHSMLKHGLPIT